MDQKNKPRGASGGDVVGMISIVAFVAAMFAIVMQVMDDWRGTGLRGFGDYLKLAGILLAPCFAGVLVAAHLVRRESK